MSTQEIYNEIKIAMQDASLSDAALNEAYDAAFFGHPGDEQSMIRYNDAKRKHAASVRRIKDLICELPMDDMLRLAWNAGSDFQRYDDR